LPQVPQWLLSKRVSRQTPPHCVNPPGHETPHAPAAQTSPVAHALEHTPQLVLSLLRSLQIPEHEVSPVPQLVEHAPPLQTCPVGQALPHVPQFVGSFFVSRHVPEQSLRSEPHVVSHLLPTQSWPAAQTLPHVPQFSRSLVRLAQVRVPVPASPPPHSASPPPHDSWHLPALQTSPAAHFVPQAPQLSRSVSSVAHVPLQSFCVAGHDTEHLPATHSRPAPHALPHAPQLLRSSDVSTHVLPHIDLPVSHETFVSVMPESTGVGVDSFPLEHAGAMHAIANIALTRGIQRRFMTGAPFLRVLFALTGGRPSRLCNRQPYLKLTDRPRRRPR